MIFNFYKLELPTEYITLTKLGTSLTLPTILYALFTLFRIELRKILYHESLRNSFPHAFLPSLLK
jgi:hypothetical protein